MRAVKHTHTRSRSSQPDRKCGSEHNVTRHNLTFTTCRLWCTHSHTDRVQMQKVSFKAQEGRFLLSYVGQKGLLGLILVPCDLESLCLEAFNHQRGRYASFEERITPRRTVILNTKPFGQYFDPSATRAQILEAATMKLSSYAGRRSPCSSVFGNQPV